MGNSLYNALPEQMRVELDNRNSLMLWRLCDKRPSKCNTALVPWSEAMFIIIRHEEGVGMSITTLYPCGLDEQGWVKFGHSRYKPSQFKLLCAKRGRYSLPHRHPLRPLVSNGCAVFKDMCKLSLDPWAFQHLPQVDALVKNDGQPDMVSAVIYGLIKGSVRPCRQSDYRASELMKKAIAFKRIGQNMVFIFEDQRGHTRTWSLLPSFSRPVVEAGDVLWKGKLLALPFDTQESLTPDAMSVLRYEAEQIRYVSLRGIPRHHLDHHRPCYIRSTDWQLMYKGPNYEFLDVNPLPRNHFSFLRKHAPQELRRDGILV